MGKTQSYVAVKVSFRVARKEISKRIFTLLCFFTQVKVLDDNVFAIRKSRCIFLFFCVIIWSFEGVKKRLGHAQIGLLLRLM